MLLTAVFVLCIVAMMVGAYLIAAGKAVGLVVFPSALAVMFLAIRFLPKDGGGGGSDGGHAWDGDGGGGGGDGGGGG